MKLRTLLAIILTLILAVALAPPTSAGRGTGTTCIQDTGLPHTLPGPQLGSWQACVGAHSAVAVDAGVGHTCVLLSTGNVDCYGANGDGEAADYMRVP